MIKIIKKFIIYLFEKYCYDLWVEKIQQNEKLKLIKENNLQENEVEEFLISREQDKNRTIFDSGREFENNRLFEQGYIR